MGIRAWLNDIGLPQYAETFESQQISPDLLGELDHETLKQLGVDALGHRLTMLREINNGRNDQPDDAPAGQPVSSSQWEAERRQLTIVFCDMVGSTSISSQLDPEEFRDLIRLYHETVSDAAKRSGGHVAQFLGDGSMIYFGYPNAQEDATERAVNMGLALIDALAGLEPFPGGRLQTRIGIATGLVVVGDLVGRGLNEGAVVSGDAPNLAARLQTVAEPDNIVVGERTHDLLGRSFETEQLEPMDLKGIPGLTKAWRIIGPSDSANRFEARRPQQMTPLVGRDAEMDQLVDGWQQAKQGHGSTVMLSGEAGLGKSRLIRELKSRTKPDETAMIQLQCSPYFTNTALHPIMRGLEFASGFRQNDTPDARLDKVLKFFDLDQAEPDETGALVAGLMGLPANRFPPLKISVELQRARLFDIILTRVRTAAEQTPLVLIFEDLHWADPTTLEILQKLIESAPAGRFLVVGTYRPEFSPPWGTHQDVHLCPVQRLGSDDVQTLITHLASGEDLSDEVRAALASRADGIPFFAEELTKSVMQMDRRTAIEVPTSLRDTLMARLDTLEGPRHIAQIASVIGREFNIDLLAAVSRKTPASLLESLGQLAEADLIFQSKQPRTWVFRHALIRDTAYESLLNRSRQEMHLRIAQSMESQFPERANVEPEFVARHYAEAGEPASAAGYWLAAGQSARQRGIVNEANAHIIAGLDQVGRMPKSAARETLELQLHVAHGATLVGIKGHAAPEVGDAFARAAELDARGTSPDFQIAFHSGFGAHLAMRGEVKDGHVELSKMVDVAGTEPRLLMSASSVMAWSFFNKGEFETSVKWGERTEKLFRDGLWNSSSPRHTTGDPLVISRCFHAASLWSRGYPERAMAKAQSALNYAETLNDPYSLIYAQLNGVCRVASLQGQSDAVLQITTEAMEYSRRMGYLFGVGYSLFWQSEALAQTGDLDTAIKNIGASIAACQAASNRYHEPHFRAMQAVMLATRGDHAAALAALDGLEELVTTSGELWQAADVRCARARVALSAGETDTAETAWRDALEQAHALKSPSWELRAATGLADLMARQGQKDAAKDLLAPIHARFTEGFETIDLKRAAALLEDFGHPAQAEA